MLRAKGLKRNWLEEPRCLWVASLSTARLLAVYLAVVGFAVCGLAAPSVGDEFYSAQAGTQAGAQAGGAADGTQAGGARVGAQAGLGRFSPVTPGCILQAARMQGIPPHIILGLLKTEGGHLGSESLNKDGSIDLGPMQINNRTWVPLLARAHFGGDQRIAYIMLRDHGCYSVFIGAWIFGQYLSEAHGNYADAVGFYNSHNIRQKEAYERRFAMNFKELFGWMASGNAGK